VATLDVDLSAAPARVDAVLAGVPDVEVPEFDGAPALGGNEQRLRPARIVPDGAVTASDVVLDRRFPVAVVDDHREAPLRVPRIEPRGLDVVEMEPVVGSERHADARLPVVGLLDGEVLEHPVGSVPDLQEPVFEARREHELHVAPVAPGADDPEVGFLQEAVRLLDQILPRRELDQRVAAYGSIERAVYGVVSGTVHPQIVDRVDDGVEAHAVARLARPPGVRCKRNWTESGRRGPHLEIRPPTDLSIRSVLYSTLVRPLGFRSLFTH